LGDLAHLIFEEAHGFDGDLTPYAEVASADPLFASVAKTLIWASDLRVRAEATMRAARKARMRSELHRRELRNALAKEVAAFSDKFDETPPVTSRHLLSLAVTGNSEASHAESVFVDTECSSALGNRLRETRGILGMTQTQLAKKAGVGVSTIHRIETDPFFSPRIVTITKLAKGMGVNFAWFSRGEGAKHGDDRSEDHAS
jgi:DNA-binding XRE family transcriptional regulator